MGEEDMGMLEEHSMSFLNRAYPAWVYMAEGAINTISLFKTSLRQEAKLRPALLHHHGACLHPPRPAQGRRHPVGRVLPGHGGVWGGVGTPELRGSPAGGECGGDQGCGGEELLPPPGQPAVQVDAADRPRR